ncbi:hypothetical protein [Enterobacter hormaechei]|nr:hypothetical protein [Enterobacter hormaechei]
MALSRLWLNILTSKRRIAFTATAFVRVVGGLRKKKSPALATGLKEANLLRN